VCNRIYEARAVATWEMKYVMPGDCMFIDERREG